MGMHTLMRVINCFLIELNQVYICCFFILINNNILIL